MLVRKSKFRELEVEVMLLKCKLHALDLTLDLYCKMISDIIEQNQNIIDTNKLVLDKLEEYLKANPSSK